MRRLLLALVFVLIFAAVASAYTPPVIWSADNETGSGFDGTTGIEKRSWRWLLSAGSVEDGDWYSIAVCMWAHAGASNVDVYTGLHICEQGSSQNCTAGTITYFPDLTMTVSNDVICVNATNASYKVDGTKSYLVGWYSKDGATNSAKYWTAGSTKGWYSAIGTNYTANENWASVSASSLIAAVIYLNGSATAPAAATSYGALNLTYTTPEYEANRSYFTYWIWWNSTEIDVGNALTNGELYWNGTSHSIYSAMDYGAGDNYTRRYDFYVDVPLVEVNFTNVSVYASMIGEWIGNSTTFFINSTTANHSIRHAYYWGTYAPDTAVLEGVNIALSATPTIATGANSSAIASVLALFNNSNYTLTNSGGTWTGSTTAPDVTAPSAAFVSNATMAVTWDGITYNRISDNVTITVYEPTISTTCAGGDYAINFTFFEEANPTTANASNMDMSFSWWANADHSGIQYNGTATATNTLNVTLCLSPPGATLYMDSFQVYRNNASSSAVRNYFLTNATVTNTTSTINLFNVLAAESALLTLTIRDRLVNQPGVFVLMERYYPGENLFRTVEIGKTDADGKTFLYPVPNDVYYRFLVIRDYVTEYSGEPREIGIDTFTIDISGTTELEYFSYKGIDVACNKTGDIIICSLVNPSGLDVGAILLVKEIGIYTDTVICSTNVTSVTSSTLLCNVSGYSGMIQADLFFIAPESLLTAWTETFNGSGTNVFGGLGLFIAMLVIIGSALLLGYSPALTLIGATLGLVISAITGIAALSITSVILILVAAGFLIAKVRT
jgi:hypothetical protein